MLVQISEKKGVPIQYSVFLVEASATQIAALVIQIAKMIDTNADDVRAYRLPENGWQVSLGAPILPDDIFPGATQCRATRTSSRPYSKGK